VAGVFSQRSNYLFIRRLCASVLALAPVFVLIGCASAGPHLPPPEGVLTLSATSFHFSTVVVGHSSTQTLHLTNTGNAPLTIGSLTLKSQEFEITGPSVPCTIPPTESANYTVSFKPTSSGNLSASLQITTNLSIVPTAVSLAGVAEKAFVALEVSPASISFGNLDLKTTGTQNVTLKNTGDISTTVSGVTVTGAGFGYSNLSPGFSLTPNQTVTFQVWFKPQTAGNASGTVTILSANQSSPAQIPVSGAGVSPPPTFASLQVSPASLSFGNLKLKTTGTQNVTLKNTGGINLTVSGITIVGSGFGYSDISPGFSLAPNQTVTFQVWFTPQTAGSTSGSVTILSPNIASPEEIPVSGDGISASTTPPAQPPAPPVQHTVALSWQASSSSVSGYRVYRSTTSGSDFSPLTSTISALSYTDDTVSDGTTYYYVVIAVDSAGDESPYSNQVSAAIPAS
jgi:hypothetical protein